jgi:hypothetical protein
MDMRRVDWSEGERFANDQKAEFYIETSAVTGQGIEQLFSQLLDGIRKQKSDGIAPQSFDIGRNGAGPAGGCC